MPLAVNIAATMQVDQTGSATIGGAIPAYSKGKTADISLSDGSGSGQANKCYVATRTLASGASEDLDLAGVLLDPLGATLTFLTIKGLIIRADGGNTTALTVSPAPANGFVGPFGAAAQTQTVRPGGFWGFAAPQTGFTVTAATGDLLRVANAAGAAATYTIEIVGT